jgi:peptidoglycan/LPS O-acetylase OafA/YrhL
VQKQEYFGALDSLRGIAALQVVFYHLPAWYLPLYRSEWVRNGGLMVNFFFVLSGFVLCHSYGDRIHSGKDFSKFIALRIGRLYPVHVTFLLLFVGVECVKYVALAHGGAGASANAPFHENTPGAFIECLFLVHALGFTKHSSAFNFPSWSISTEFYTYLIFALAVRFVPKRARTLAYAALAAVSLSLLIFAKPWIGEFHWWLRCISGFFIGCLTCACYQALKGRRLAGAWSIGAVAGLLIFLGVPLTGAKLELIFPISALLVVSLALTPDRLASAVFSWGPFRWLGEVSYSLYMSHAIVLWVARQACRSVLKAPDIVIDGATTASVSPGVGATLSALTIAAALMLAALTFRLLENPGRTATRLWVSSWGARSTAAALAPPRAPAN